MNVKDKLDTSRELKRLVRDLSKGLLIKFAENIDNEELTETTSAWYEIEGFGKITMSVTIDMED